MKIFYCRIGWMSSYRGCSTEKPINGGLYNKDNIGHEVYNYLGYNGRYYGFVESGGNSSIHIERLGARKMTGEKQDSLCLMPIHLYRICTQQMMEIPRYSILKMRQLHFHHLHMSRK